MTIQAFISKIAELQRIRPAFAAERFLLPAGKKIEELVKVRVFMQGKDTNGAPIASGYSTKPKKFKKEQFAKKGAFKANSVIWGRGANKGTKTPAMRLKGGYKEFRSIQGRRTDMVNLILSGSLQKSIQSGISGSVVTVGIASEGEVKKRYLLERKIYRKGIFFIQPREAQAAEKEIAFQIEKFIQNIGQ